MASVRLGLMTHLDRPQVHVACNSDAVQGRGALANGMGRTRIAVNRLVHHGNRAVGSGHKATTPAMNFRKGEVVGTAPPRGYSGRVGSIMQYSIRR